MDTGLKPNEEQIKEFNLLKFKQTYKYITFALNETNSGIEIVDKGEPSVTHEEMIKSLPENDARIVILDFSYKSKEDNPRNVSKIILINWMPSSTKVNRRFTTSSSVAGIKSKMEGIQKDVQVSDTAELAYESLVDLMPQ